MVKSNPGAHKRLIVCCDGTWMDSLGKRGAEPQSNVTRISRVLRRTCHDGTHQIIMYHPGVGSTDSRVDKMTGGMFGSGLDQDIREVYNFICTNYVDGDDIILLGFSRGAFTARSVADMIATVGLLTPQGHDQFYAVFEDYENMSNSGRDLSLFLDPEILPYNGEKGVAKLKWEADRKVQYENWLVKKGLTRHTYEDGVTEIKIKAVGVWDTVGTLGIPPAPIIGLRGSSDQYFTNTQVSDHVENAFQALALDEPRYAFRPALWEKLDGNKTNLKQVWFPGSHSVVGGGWHEQQIANITLAWMCDQLSTVGVEFNPERMAAIFNEGLRYSAGHPFSHVPGGTWTSWLWPRRVLPWANSEICSVDMSSVNRDTADCDGKHEHPTGPKEKLWKLARSWGLGQMRSPTSLLQTMAGSGARNPGTFKRTDPDTNQDTDEPLINTNERVHSSVRIRLACQGLGADDGDIWECKPLTRAADGSELWKLERGPGLDAGDGIKGSSPAELDRGMDGKLYSFGDRDGRWRWVLSGKQKQDKRGGGGPAAVSQSQSQSHSQVEVLPEEPMSGYWERYLLALTAGNPDVWRWAEEKPPFGLV